ncbi:hypothetical protein FN846DRAFT_905190 [Sphaerosporella brunnea]|uniref:Uncharacterized protein n=1 Tax=Sphaerosporella brunnea TaxID=1250544 RepID=A0A5J5F2M8_9PEZI|nr:hypothetical protein FN846DRAFT_905190 [Sphaerosporella brunnea]
MDGLASGAMLEAVRYSLRLCHASWQTEHCIGLYRHRWTGGKLSAASHETSYSDIIRLHQEVELKPPPSPLARSLLSTTHLADLSLTLHARKAYQQQIHKHKVSAPALHQYNRHNELRMNCDFVEYKLLHRRNDPLMGNTNLNELSQSLGLDVANVRVQLERYFLENEEWLLNRANHTRWIPVRVDRLIETKTITTDAWFNKAIELWVKLGVDTVDIVQPALHSLHILLKKQVDEELTVQQKQISAAPKKLAAERGLAAANTRVDAADQEMAAAGIRVEAPSATTIINNFSLSVRVPEYPHGSPVFPIRLRTEPHSTIRTEGATLEPTAGQTRTDAADDERLFIKPRTKEAAKVQLEREQVLLEREKVKLARERLLFDQAVAGGSGSASPTVASAATSTSAAPTSVNITPTAPSAAPSPAPSGDITRAALGEKLGLETADIGLPALHSIHLLLEKKVDEKLGAHNCTFLLCSSNTRNEATLECPICWNRKWAAARLQEAYAARRGNAWRLREMRKESDILMAGSWRLRIAQSSDGGVDRLGERKQAQVILPHPGVPTAAPTALYSSLYHNREQRTPGLSDIEESEATVRVGVVCPEASLYMTRLVRALEDQGASPAVIEQILNTFLHSIGEVV